MSADESNDLIAPCRCKGSSKFVHRACLDQWRATKGPQRPLERGERVAQPNSNPFTHCTTCGFKFRIRTVAVAGEEYNLLKYRLYVARDLTGVALALFAALSLLAGVLWLLGTLPFTSDYLLWANPVMHDRAPLAAPGFWPHFVLAVCVALVLLGFVGLILYGTGVFDRMGVRLRMPCQVGIRIRVLGCEHVPVRLRSHPQLGVVCLQCRNNRCFVGGFGGPILLILVAVFLVVGGCTYLRILLARERIR
jgi:hypothetical protein